MRAVLRPSPPTRWLMSWAVCATLIATAAGHSGFAGVAESLATAAVLLATAVLAARTLIGPGRPYKSHQTLGRTLRARVLRAGAMRHSDPNAPGRPRPRAPGSPTLAV